ncbi:MAG: V-type ATP synthase subunit D [Phycisphaerae bacterium]|nr:V-type ATP synthase subunit D [Phycisphaerae bacterium]
MEQVSATRTEMLTRRSQIRLAEQGAELLRSKRDALVREFLAELRRFVEARKTMRRSVMEAVQALMQTLAVDGQEAVLSAALVSRRAVTLDVTPKNFWGTKVYDMTSDYTVRHATQRGYGAAATSARLEETAEGFEQAVEDILRLAPMDLKLRALAEDMRKTSRRVNALEQRLLPQLQEQVRMIQNALDQREREDIFRLKRLKRKKELQKLKKALAK